MEKWITEQDSLYHWNISSGSSSPKAQWLITRYNGEEEKGSCRLGEGNICSSGRKQVQIISESINNFNKNKKMRTIALNAFICRLIFLTGTLFLTNSGIATE